MIVYVTTAFATVLAVPEFLETEVCLLVDWCFEPSPLLGIISGLKETFIKRNTVERTNKAEVRPEEQSENGGLPGEFVE